MLTILSDNTNNAIMNPTTDLTNVTQPRTNQAVSLVDWLQTPDSNPGVFVTYPAGYDVINVMAAMIGAMLPRLAGKPFLMMVQNPGDLDRALGVQLPQELYLPYGESPLLEQAIQANAWILVDSVTIFRTLRVGELAQRKGSESRFIVMGTLGYDQVDLEYLNERLPGIYSLYASFIDRRIRLEYHLEVTTMTPEQDQRYAVRREAEQQHLRSGTSQQKHEARQGLHTKQVGNFVYPEDIQRVLDLPRERRVEAAPDQPAPLGWINQQAIQELGQRSPKLQRLLTLILGQRDQRQIVFSRFKNRYGVNLINAFLTLLGVPTMMITGDDRKVEQRQRKIEQFNQLPSGILLTNIPLVSDVTNVTSVHFFEGFDEAAYRGIMDHVFKAGLYPDQATIHIFIYVTQRLNPPGADAADAISYRIFSERHVMQMDLYNRVIVGSIPIWFDAPTNQLTLILTA